MKNCSKCNNIYVNEEEFYAVCECGAFTSKKYSSLEDIHAALENDNLDPVEPSGGDNIRSFSGIEDLRRKTDIIRVVPHNMLNSKYYSEEFAKVYKAKVIEQGVCKYDDEVVLIKADAIAQMASSFKGKPVTIEHPENLGYALSKENVKEKAVGYVTNCYKYLDDGYWVDFLIFDEEAQRKIDNSEYKVSCTYIPGNCSLNTGTWHNVPYDREILDGKFVNLALVTNPRYEDTVIYKNSKDEVTYKNSKETVMFKLFQKETKVLEANNPVVDLGEGVEVPLEDMVRVYKNSKTTKIPTDSIVEIDGQKVKVSDLVKVYKNSIETQADEEKKLKDMKKDIEDLEKHEKKEDKEDKEKKDEEPKKNSHFEAMKNSRNQSTTYEKVESLTEKIERGQQRYGASYPVQK